MSSRADTLKIAQADIETVGRHLAAARRGRTWDNNPVAEAGAAVRLLERTARRVCKSFGLEKKDAD